MSRRSREKEKRRKIVSRREGAVKEAGPTDQH